MRFVLLISALVLWLQTNSVYGQTSDCAWITLGAHSLCHTNDGFHGDGTACDNGKTCYGSCGNCGEGCCSWEFQIKNDFEGWVLDRVSICADTICDDLVIPLTQCQQMPGPNHICDLCPVKFPWTSNWVEDPACPRLYPATGTLGDGSCDSVCRSSCVHLIETAGGLPYKSTVKIPVGFTGCTPWANKCIAVCIYLRNAGGAQTRLCCRVTLPPCDESPIGPAGYDSCGTGSGTSTDPEITHILAKPLAPNSQLELEVTCAVGATSAELIELRSAEGGIIDRQATTLNAGTNRLRFDGQGFEPGIYLLTLRRGADRSKTTAFVVR